MTFAPRTGTARWERRAAVAESLSEIVRVISQMDIAIEDASSAGAVDPDGHLRAAVRAVLPAAAKIDGFDVTVTAGPGGGWSVRVRCGSDGLTARLNAPGESGGSAADPGVTRPTGYRSDRDGPVAHAAALAVDPPLPARAGVVAQLADLLRREDGGPR